MIAIIVFALLQVADVVTTMIGFKLGAGEASPFVRMLVQGSTSPLHGLLAAKLVAVILGAFVVYSRRSLRKVNIWFTALIVWNLVIILMSSRGWSL